MEDLTNENIHVATRMTTTNYRQMFFHENRGDRCQNGSWHRQLQRRERYRYISILYIRYHCLYRACAIWSSRRDRDGKDCARGTICTCTCAYVLISYFLHIQFSHFLRQNCNLIIIHNICTYLHVLFIRTFTKYELQSI